MLWMRSLRLGGVGVTFCWYGWRDSLRPYRWGLLKWRYFDKESWKHGTAYVGPVKIIW